MALTPEDIQALKDSILGTVGDLIDTKIDSKISPLETNISQMFTRMTETVGSKSKESFNEFLDQLIDEADNLTVDSSDDEDDEEYEEEEYETPIADNRESVETMRLKKQLQDMQAQIEAERQARENAELARSKQEKQSQIISQISGKVISGKEAQLLKLLEMDGKIDGDFQYETRDQFGPIKKPVTEVIDQLLDSEYQHFAPARAGNGTGGTNSSSSQPRVEIKSELIGSALNDPNKLKELAKALDAEIKG